MPNPAVARWKSRPRTRVRRRVVHEAVKKVGRQDNQPRIFFEARYLEDAGFQSGQHLELVPKGEKLIVNIAPRPTGKSVQEKKRTGVPVIDLCSNRILGEIFGDATRVYVRIEEGRIIISPHPIDLLIRSRPRDGTAGSLFCGIGGLDESARLAGFQTVWAIDVDEKALQYYRANHPGVRTMEMSVQDAALKKCRSVELVTIGLPCQPWVANSLTTDNRGTKRDRTLPKTAHKFGHLIASVLQMIPKINARTIILENAEGFSKSETIYILRGMLLDLGYHVEWRVVDPRKHGYLQGRKRTVLVAQTPEPDGTVPEPWPLERPCTMTAGDLMDPVVPESRWWDAETKAKRLASEQHSKDMGRGFRIQRVRVTDTSVPTITKEVLNSKPDTFTWFDPETDRYRYPTPSECLRIMTFREDYVLPNGERDAGQLLGQAVIVDLFRQILARSTGRDPLAPRRQVVEGGEVAGPPLHDLPLFAQHLN